VITAGDNGLARSARTPQMGSVPLARSIPPAFEAEVAGSKKASNQAQWIPL